MQYSGRTDISKLDRRSKLDALDATLGFITGSKDIVSQVADAELYRDELCADLGIQTPARVPKAKSEPVTVDEAVEVVAKASDPKGFDGFVLTRILRNAFPDRNPLNALAKGVEAKRLEVKSFGKGKSGGNGYRLSAAETKVRAKAAEIKPEVKGGTK